MVDLADAADTDRALAEVVTGPVHTMIHNAAILRVEPIEEVTLGGRPYFIIETSLGQVPEEHGPAGSFCEDLTPQIVCQPGIPVNRSEIEKGNGVG